MYIFVGVDGACHDPFLFLSKFRYLQSGPGRAYPHVARQGRGFALPLRVPVEGHGFQGQADVAFD